MLRPLGPLVAGALAQWAPLPTTLPYLPQLVLAAWALPLAAHTPETVRHDRARDADDGLWRQMRIRGLGEPRFLWVVLPLAPWFSPGWHGSTRWCASAAIAMAYLPGLRAYTSATVLLLCVAALAASTLTLTVWQARRTAALSLNPARARR